MTTPKKIRHHHWLTPKNIRFLEKMKEKLQVSASEIVRRALDKWEEEEG